MALTKMEKSMIQKYETSKHSELYQVYGNYSNAKARSFDQIKSMMHDFNGYDLRITSYCTTNYSCAFRYTCAGNEWLVYLTYRNTFYIPLFEN